MKRGDLIHYRCYVGGRVLGEHRSIYHGDNRAHEIGKRKKRRGKPESEYVFIMNDHPSDVTKKIRFGWSITRTLDP